jgi:ubiquinone/menaquinone biosynthesis C-methylase UbiE
VNPTPLDYDQLAADYARHRQVHPGVLQALHQAAHSLRGRRPPRVLEAGCGTGNYLLALAASTGCRGWGIDPSEGMLAQARARWARMAAHLQQATQPVGAGTIPPRAPSTAVQFRVGSAERLDFAEASFDLVYSVDVIHHLSDKSRYTKEACRVLAPGGRLCTVTDSASIIRRREPLATYFPETVEADLARYPPIAALRALYEQTGLVEIAERSVEFRYPLDDLQAYRDKAFSVLHLIPEESFRRSIARLERDLQGKDGRKPIHCVSRYTLLWGVK